MNRAAAPLLLALYEPDIAQNAGAMMRTCACLGVDAAIIEPAGFRVGDSRFRRAGMDYLDSVSLARHDLWARFEAWRAATGRRLTLLTTRGETRLWDFAFRPGDILLVGRELAGRPIRWPPRRMRAYGFRSSRRCGRSTSASPRRSPWSKPFVRSAACHSEAEMR